MGFFRRKQGRLETTAALADISALERDAGMDWLQGAERVFVEIRALETAVKESD